MAYGPSGELLVGNVYAPTSDAPNGSTMLVANTSSLSNAAGTVTLAGASGKTTYLSHLLITGQGASVATAPEAQIVGLTSGTLAINIPVAAANAPVSVNLAFRPALPASAANTPVSITLPAFGAGSTKASVVLVGYQL